MSVAQPLQPDIRSCSPNAEPAMAARKALSAEPILMHVEPLPITIRRDMEGREWLVIQAIVRGHPRRRHRNGTIWFEVPAEFAGPVGAESHAEDRLDPFARAILYSAMEAGRDVRIHGNVSATLLANLEVYQRIITTWWPEYHPVHISADQEIEPSGLPDPRMAGEAIMGFSGGMDSIHSLYCHHHRLHGRNNRRIPICLFVHGFDIALADSSYDAAFRRAEAISNCLGSQLVRVRSNIKRMLPSWPNAHGAALAATLSLFSPRFRQGLIASTFNYRNLLGHRFGYGSTPLSDWLLSSHDFQIVHDFADKRRVEKTRVLAECQVAREKIRVCWAGDDLSRNCGKCSKCISQMLCMRAIGIEDLSAFARPLSASSVWGMQVTSAAHWEELQACHLVADAAGLGSSDEFLALRCVLDKAREAFAPPNIPDQKRPPRAIRLLARTRRRLSRLAGAWKRSA
ncbi:MAG: hypothetical protein JW829_04575 [Pirellulales bacterium]|nr:hypothetical protein [Pirellulales bacterium]